MNHLISVLLWILMVLAEISLFLQIKGFINFWSNTFSCKYVRLTAYKWFMIMIDVGGFLLHIFALHFCFVTSKRQALVRCSVHKDSPHLPAQYSNVPPKSQKFLESIISTHLHLVPPAEFAPPPLMSKVFVPCTYLLQTSFAPKWFFVLLFGSGCPCPLHCHCQSKLIVTHKRVETPNTIFFG